MYHLPRNCQYHMLLTTAVPAQTGPSVGLRVPWWPVAVSESLCDPDMERLLLSPLRSTTLTHKQESQDTPGCCKRHQRARALWHVFVYGEGCLHSMGRARRVGCMTEWLGGTTDITFPQRDQIWCQQEDICSLWPHWQKEECPCQVKNEEENCRWRTGT